MPHHNISSLLKGNLEQSVSLKDSTVFFSRRQINALNNLSQAMREETGHVIMPDSPEKIMELLAESYRCNNHRIEYYFIEAANTLSQELRTFFNV